MRKGCYMGLEVNVFSEPTLVATIATEAAYKHGGEWLKQWKSYIEANI